MVHDLMGWYYPGYRVIRRVGRQWLRQKCCDRRYQSCFAPLTAVAWQLLPKSKDLDNCSTIQNAECRIICCGRGGTRFLYFADATVEMTDM